MILSVESGKIDGFLANELSFLLAKKATDGIFYSYDKEQTLCNRVDAQVR